MRILFLALLLTPVITSAESISFQKKSHSQLQATIRAATVEAEQEDDFEEYDEEEFIVDFAVPEGEDEEVFEESEEFAEETVDTSTEEEVSVDQPEDREVIDADQNQKEDTEEIHPQDIGAEIAEETIVEDEVESELDAEEEYEIADTAPYEADLEELDDEKTVDQYIIDLHITDPTVIDVSIVDGMMHFEYQNAAKLLGLIPIRFTYKVFVEDDSTFQIEEPWWLMFVSDRLAIFKRELRTALSTIPDETETEDRTRHTLQLMGTVSRMIKNYE